MIGVLKRRNLDNLDILEGMAISELTSDPYFSCSMRGMWNRDIREGFAHIISFLLSIKPCSASFCYSTVFI